MDDMTPNDALLMLLAELRLTVAAKDAKIAQQAEQIKALQAATPPAKVE